MALTYTYDTGQVSHFALKRVEGDCHVDKDRTTLIGVFCRHCKYYAGIEDNLYVICEYHKEDDPGASYYRNKIVDNLIDNALKAYYD